MTILLIENSVLLIERLREIILESGIEVDFFFASTYNEALPIYEQRLPDVVIMDAYLPENQSTNLFKHIKQNKENVCFVILCYKAVFLNFDCYLQKNADYLIDKFHEFEIIPSILKSISNPKTQSS